MTMDTLGFACRVMSYFHTPISPAQEQNMHPAHQPAPQIDMVQPYMNNPAKVWGSIEEWWILYVKFLLISNMEHLNKIMDHSSG